MIGTEVKYLGKKYEVVSLAVDNKKVVDTILSVKNPKSVVDTDYKIFQGEGIWRLYADKKIWNLKKLK